MKRFISFTFAFIAASIILLAQQTGTPNQLQVRTDADGYLATTSSAQTLPLSQPTQFNNARLRTDANGNLLVTSSGSSSFTNVSSSGQFLAANGTAAAPSYSFTTTPALGFYWGDSASVIFTNGTARLAFTSAGLNLASDRFVSWTNGTGNPITTIDVQLARDAANTLALRNGTAAQTFNVYNTWTNASNYERISVGYSAGNADFSHNYAGTGASRTMRIYNNGAGDLQLGAGSALRWAVGSGGHFTTLVDNTYDIGASGATRPRTIYAGTSLVTPSVVASFVQSTGSGAYYKLGNISIAINTAPTIASGFGAGNSVTASNGTAAFTINTGAASQTGVITMPAATTGWACNVNDITTPASFNTEAIASTTTSVTVQNYSRTTGLAINWTANDVIQLMCLGY